MTPFDPSLDSPDLTLPTDDKLSSVARSVTEWETLSKEVAADEAKLKLDKARLFQLETETIPLAMDEVGLAKVVLTNGLTIEVKPFYQGNVPTLGGIEKAKGPERATMLAKREFIFNWLRSHNHHGLIKAEVTLAFSKGQEADRTEALTLLTSHGFEPKVEENVHPSTFTSWVKQCQEQGISLPLTELGVFVGRRAVIK
jgi:hypothetical protein